MKRLILNADDFGLTSGVNQAILELNQRGTLTSATLMAHASATEQAIALAKSTPSLGVGCHIVLVDGQPLLSPHLKIPRLANPADGRFRSSLGAFVQDLLLGRIPACEIEAEASAQIALLQHHGLQPTHIDTHKHTHMFPAVLRPLLRAARSAGIRAVRNPFEPLWSLHATPGAPGLRRAQVRLLRAFEPAFRRIVSEEGFLTTDGAIGVLATGTLDSPTLQSLLAAMPSGTWELVTHPGYSDTALAQANTRLLASRDVERKALLGASLSPGVELIHFAQLSAGAAAAYP